MLAIKHGGERAIIRERYPDVTGQWIDLSTGVNPIAYPWIDKISKSELNEVSGFLPDQDLVTACRDAWTGYLGANNPNDWCLAAGSQSVINLFPQLFPDHSVCLPDPTYGEHVRVWLNEDRSITRFTSGDIENFEFPSHAVVIITNPNNPDGRCYAPYDLLDLAASLKAKDSYLVIDEAFCDGAPEQSLATFSLPDNVLIMRSFGKFFGLAGLRIGCVRAAPELRKKLQTLLGPWPVNGVALLVAQYALLDAPWIETTRERLRSNSDRLNSILTRNGLEVIGSTDLFNLVSSDNAEQIADHLAHHAIYTRTFLEHKNHIRFGLPADDEGFLRLNSALIL